MEKPTDKIELSTKIIDLSLNSIDIKGASNFDASILSDKSKFQFEFNVNMNFDLGKKLLSITLTTNFFADIEKTISLGKMSSSGIFEIYNIDQIISMHEGKIPNIILANFIGIVLATTRGFLILKSENTIMSEVIMPIIDTMSFFQQANSVE